ncbi:hypothetical protein BBFGKLBO_02154 [Synechococcus sp. CBW1107]|nr:hypothetical protein BBFGKLBO_02154 [Synechococcus sp. CBW1107]
MIIGEGGNVGVLTGSEGPLLVDAKFARLALPVLTFENTLRLHLDDGTIDLLHLPAAHTDGNTIVHFNTANVIHRGDGCWNGMYPFIDAFHGGSLWGDRWSGPCSCPRGARDPHHPRAWSRGGGKG